MTCGRAASVEGLPAGLTFRPGSRCAATPPAPAPAGPHPFPGPQGGDTPRTANGQSKP